ncbi:respiratory nitrate reductase gamma subunit [Alkalispirillum mobile]|uniref:nitrate reductase (quinone) n=1 Tax=Alkalispirillum mobile TaxID=85925 RepID=A0A498C857_9GAMM|nr:respiratory nitrate reductase subunit gamma [Alkalispirillum mobile]RLK48758.1 respiratory nitrate reductase gamma subunit [Alkalispirillum mobile]
MFATYLHDLAFAVFPYIAGTVFLIGSLLRFEKSQYTWKSNTTQLMSGGDRFRLGINLFHIGIIALFFGHLFGLLTPQAVYSAVGLTAGGKQILAIVAGTIFGLITLVGVAILLHRRLTDPRVRKTSYPMDSFILILLALQLVTGLLTVPASMGSLDGGTMLKIVAWAQGLVTFQADAAATIYDIHWIYKIHMFLGMLMFLVFPFTRLVHIWSVPYGYIWRAYQVVRARAVS